MKKPLPKWRKLSLEIAGSAFGHRIELDLIPFQWAKPQIGFSPSMGRKKRLPRVKIGPLHLWTMLSTRWELSIGADLDAHFHLSAFQRVYPNSVVWPDYAPREA